MHLLWMRLVLGRDLEIKGLEDRLAGHSKQLRVLVQSQDCLYAPRWSQMEDVWRKEVPSWLCWIRLLAGVLLGVDHRSSQML